MGVLSPPLTTVQCKVNNRPILGLLVSNKHFEHSLKVCRKCIGFIILTRSVCPEMPDAKPERSHNLLWKKLQMLSKKEWISAFSCIVLRDSNYLDCFSLRAYKCDDKMKILHLEWLCVDIKDSNFHTGCVWLIFHIGHVRS